MSLCRADIVEVTGLEHTCCVRNDLRLGVEDDSYFGILEAGLELRGQIGVWKARPAQGPSGDGYVQWTLADFSWGGESLHGAGAGCVTTNIPFRLRIREYSLKLQFECCVQLPSSSWIHTHRVATACVSGPLSHGHPLGVCPVSGQPQYLISCLWAVVPWDLAFFVVCLGFHWFRGREKTYDPQSLEGRSHQSPRSFVAFPGHWKPPSVLHGM